MHPTNRNSLDQTPPDIVRLKSEASSDVIWHSPVGIFTTTPDGRFTFANPAMARIYGYSSPAELIASITDISSQIYADPAERDIFQRQLREQGELINHDYQHLRRDGTVFWVSLNARAIYDKKGKLLHYQGFSTDITERKYATSFIETRERYLQKILDTSGEGFLVINAKGFLQEVNQTYCAMSGYSREELLGLSIGDLDTLESSDETAARTNRVQACGAEIYETLHRRKDGTIYPVELSVTWLDQDGGQLVCFGRDISDRKRAADAMRTEHRRLENIIEATRIGTWEWNVQSGEIIFNERWAAIIGYTLAELAPLSISTWEKYTHPDDLVQSTKLLAEHFAGEKTYYDFESRRRHKDGHWVWVRDLGRVISRTEDGQPLLMFGSLTDITQRKVVEEELATSHSLLKNLAQLVPGVIYQYRLYPDGRSCFPYSSPGIQDIYEVTPDAVREDAAPVFARLHLDDRNRATEAIFASARTLQTYYCEFRVVLPQQGLRWRWCQAHPQRLEDGSTLWHGIISDITERKQAEEALRESEEKYRLLFTTFPLGIAVSDPSGNIVESNDRAAALWGIAKVEQEKRRIDDEKWQIIRPDGTLMPVAEWASVRALQENRLAENTEMGIVKPGGEITWINVTAAPLLLDNYGVVITYNDITERKRVEQALRESENWFRAIIEGAPDGVFVQTERKFAYLNSRAMQLFGAKNQAELLGQSIFDRCHPDFHELVLERIRRINDVRQPVIDSLEQKFLRLDGSVVWGETIGQPIVYQGKNGALVFVRDITARKQAEAEKERLESQLQQAQKMESVGRLAGGVAHDFNNMLGVILGHTEMALEEIDPAAPLYDDLQAVQQAAERSATLTRQLLAFARKQTVAPKVIDLNDTVEGMLKMLRRLIGEGINLLWQPGRNLHPVKVDPSQIDQILVNLCVNARDAIAGVGKVAIETDITIFDDDYCAEHLGFQPGEYVLLEVSDDGCGMDQGTLNHIFEPFFTTKEQGKGTGLGLASIYGIVKQNNGFINVYSEPGQGTTIKIYFPAYAIKSNDVVEKVPDLPVDHGDETILLVEDESAILEMTTRMLERLGYTVVAAATPAEAIRLAHEYRMRIDLLMTDVVMPEMNGRELAGNLLSHYPDLKRLFMSGYTANIIAHHGVLDEGVHFIQKPFSKKDLGRKLREALEG